MGERSCLLHNIQKALQLRGVDAEIRSVGELRSVFKGLHGPFRNENLLELLRAVRKASDADIRLSMTAPTKPLGKARRKSWETKCKLTRSEILARRAAGIKVPTIARESNVGIARIYQIIKEGEKDGHMAPRSHDRL